MYVHVCWTISSICLHNDRWAGCNATTVLPYLVRITQLISCANVGDTSTKRKTWSSSWQQLSYQAMRRAITADNAKNRRESGTNVPKKKKVAYCLDTWKVSKKKMTPKVGCTLNQSHIGYWRLTTEIYNPGVDESVSCARWLTPYPSTPNRPFISCTYNVTDISVLYILVSKATVIWWLSRLLGIFWESANYVRVEVGSSKASGAGLWLCNFVGKVIWATFHHWQLNG